MSLCQTGNITTLTRVLGTRQVSLYGKVNLANILILSKLWHILRVVSLPQDVLKKITSIIYQFVMSDLFPALKGNSFLLPLLAVFNTFVTTIDLEFMHKDPVRRSSVADFFEYNHDQQQLQLKHRSACPTPTLTRIRRGLGQPPTFAPIICPQQCCR